MVVTIVFDDVNGSVKIDPPDIHPIPLLGILALINSQLTKQFHAVASGPRVIVPQAKIGGVH